MSKDSKNLIRAVDYLPTEEEKTKKHAELAKSSEPLYEELMLSDENEEVLLRIFGDMPDYSDDKIDALWEEIFNSEPKEVYEYCLSKGVDVLDGEGNPVSPWRDIAVMLKSIDKGYISLAE
ncbi:MAG: hypothetical protein AB7U85_09530 [Alphaproteobacteria bacterium]